MKRILSVMSVVVTLGLSACVTPPGHYSGSVVETNAQAVERCRFLHEFSSSSGLTGIFGLKGVDDIKHELMRQAEAMGATHVVWGKPSVGYVSTTESVRAYRCP